MVLGELDWYMQKKKKKKKETRLPTYTIHQNKLKMDKRLSCDTIKVLEENIGRKISDIPCSNIFDPVPFYVLQLFSITKRNAKVCNCLVKSITAG